MGHFQARFDDVSDILDHGIDISDEDLCKDENEKDEMEWDQIILYECPNCGHRIDGDGCITKKYSKLYHCEMEFIKCPNCHKDNVFRM